MDVLYFIIIYQKYINSAVLFSSAVSLYLSFAFYDQRDMYIYILSKIV